MNFLSPATKDFHWLASPFARLVCVFAESTISNESVYH